MHMTRVQINLSDSFIDRLDGLVKDTEASSRVEVIRRAIDIYEHLMWHTHKGWIVTMSRREGSALFIGTHSRGEAA